MRIGREKRIGRSGWNRLGAAELCGIGRRSVWRAAAGAAVGFVPIEARAALTVARSAKGQGSLEYIMMIAAASIVIVLALVMMVKLKSSVPASVTVNGSSVGITNAIAQELGSLSGNIV